MKKIKYNIIYYSVTKKASPCAGEWMDGGGPDAHMDGGGHDAHINFFFLKAPVKYRQAPVKYRMECTVAWYNAARASSAQDSLWTAVKQKKIRGRDAVILIRALCLLTTDFAGKRGRERKQE
jgi:hypothetical protein